MPLRISSNIPALTAQRYVGLAEKDLEHSLRSLASGNRIVQPGDDAAGLAISEELRGQVSGLRQARSNAENAVSMVQVAEGGLNEQNNILIRLRELGVQSASDTLGDRERQYLDQEYQALTSEFDRIAKVSKFGSHELLTGRSSEFDFHVGPNGSSDNVIKYKLDANTTSSGVGIDGLSVSSRGDAKDALGELDQALEKIAGVRANFGAIQSRLMSANNNLDVQIENVSAARSRIADVDVAEESAKMISARVKTEMGVAVMAQTNNLPGRAQRLISSMM